jgi:hypothetical protein
MANAFYILPTKLPKEIVFNFLVNIAEEIQWTFVEEEENKLMFKYYSDFLGIVKTTIEFHLLGQNLNVFANANTAESPIDIKKIASFLIKFQQLEISFFES